MAITTGRKSARKHPLPASPERAGPPWGPGWGESGPTEDELRRERLWEQLLAQGWRAEIVEGKTIVSPWAKRSHGRILDRLADQLHDLKRERGWEFYHSWAVHIPPHRGDKRLPDFLVAPHDCPEFDENQAYGHGVHLVVEVTSPDSRKDDLDVKPGEYARAGVPLYLVIDEYAEPRTVTLFSALRDDAYRTRVEVVEGDKLDRPSPFDITLDTGALFP